MKDLKMKEPTEKAGKIKKSERKTNNVHWHVMYAKFISKSNETREEKGLPLEEWRTF